MVNERMKDEENDTKVFLSENTINIYTQATLEGKSSRSDLGACDTEKKNRLGDHPKSTNETPSNNALLPGRKKFTFSRTIQLKWTNFLLSFSSKARDFPFFSFSPSRE